MIGLTTLPLNIPGLEKYQDVLQKSSPDWLRQLRQQGFAAFNELGLPTVKDEEWKYTSLSPLKTGAYTTTTTKPFKDQEALAAYVDKDDINVVLVNGAWDQGLCNMKRVPAGVIICSIEEAIKKYPQDVQFAFAQSTTNDPQGFVGLNQALFLDGVFIKVDKNAVIEPLVHVVHVTHAAAAEKMLVFPRVIIMAGQSAQVSILESHLGYGKAAYFANALTDVFVQNNAVVHYCKAQSDALEAVHIGTTRMWQRTNSTVESFSFAHGAGLARNNLSIILSGEATNTVMNGFYALEGTQHVDNHTFLNFQHPNCTGSQLYKGILNGASRAIFNGKIHVMPEAQKTSGYQLNKHLLLGADCRVDTKPELEIFADDVKCTHGATIGQLDEDEVFYFESRCIPRQQAIQMLSRGFIDDIIGTIKAAGIRRKLNKLLANTFAEIAP